MRFTRPLIAALFAVSLIAPGAVLAAPANPANEPSVTNDAGACNGNTYNQKYVDRYSSYIGDPYFDRVQGSATVRTMQVCVGFAGNCPVTAQGGTWTLLANVEQSVGSKIHQIGFGRCAGSSHNIFVYALNGANALPVPNGVGGTLQAIDGHTYTASIYKRSSGYVSFDLYDVTDREFVWTYYPTVAWDSGLNHAWWGYETWDNASDHGHQHGTGTIKLRAMGYSGAEDVATYWRQPSAAEVKCNGTGCLSNHHAHISTTTYASDTFDGDTGP